MRRPCGFGKQSSSRIRRQLALIPLLPKPEVQRAGQNDYGSRLVGVGMGHYLHARRKFRPLYKQPLIKPQEAQNGKFSLENWPFVSAAPKAISRHFVSLRVETGSQIEETGSESRNPPKAGDLQSRTRQERDGYEALANIT